MTQLTIIGLGTVGQSLGLALHQYMQQGEGREGRFTIVGADPTMNPRDASRLQGTTIDRYVADLGAAVRDAPLVIVATPTWQVYDVFRRIAPHLAAGATVTDTAPNKQLVLQWAAELLPAEVNFVGGHPVPRRQPAPALQPDEVIDEPPAADLFEGAPYCIMPAPSASEAAVNQVISMAEAVGAQPYFTDPLEHDSFQAALHDLPVVSSFALMHLLGASPSWRDMAPLAGGAFREGTRMASSDVQAVRADLVANRAYLLGWIDRYQVALQELRDLIADSDPADLEAGAGRTLGHTLIGGRNARTSWVNPQAALTPEAQAERAANRPSGSHSVVRSLLGGFLSDRLSGEDPDNRRR